MRRWLGGGAIGLLMIWLLFLATLVSVPASDRPTGVEARFVPASGQAARWVLGGEPGTPASVEHALFRGYAIAGEVPGPVINAIRPPDDVPREAVRWWRETVSPNTPELAPVLTLRAVTPAGIGLYARTGAHGVALRPGLVELPANATPGATWHSSGRAYDGGTETDYRNSATAAEPTDPTRRAEGCLVVTSVTELGGATRTDVATWCPGRGVVAGTPTLGEPLTEAEPDRWPWAGRAQAPATWPTRGEAVPARLSEGDPTFGTVPVTAAFHRQLGARVTSGGTLVAVDATGRLQAWLRRDDELKLVWWGTPAGTILSLAVLDNIVLVTTSEKRVVAYDQNGRRLWSQQTPDLVPGGALGLGRDRFVVATLTGAVVGFDLETGRRLWVTEFPAGTELAPVPAGDLVVVPGKDRALTALAADGSVRWTSENLDTDVIGVARAGDRLLAVSPSGSGYLLDAESGRLVETWVIAFGKSHTELTPGPAGTAALTSDDGVRILDVATGRERRFIPDAMLATATDTDWRILTPRTLLTVDPSGRDLARLTITPDLPAARAMTPIRGRLWVVHAEGVSWVT